MWQVYLYQETLISGVHFHLFMLKIDVLPSNSLEFSVIFQISSQKRHNFMIYFLQIPKQERSDSP